jgi:hypothetical protein
MPVAVELRNQPFESLTPIAALSFGIVDGVLGNMRPDRHRCLHFSLYLVRGMPKSQRAAERETSQQRDANRKYQPKPQTHATGPLMCGGHAITLRLEPCNGPEWPAEVRAGRDIRRRLDGNTSRRSLPKVPDRAWN